MSKSAFVMTQLLSRLAPLVGVCLPLGCGDDSSGVDETTSGSTSEGPTSTTGGPSTGTSATSATGTTGATDTEGTTETTDTEGTTETTGTEGTTETTDTEGTTETTGTEGTTAAESSSTTGSVAVCGNGTTESGETCDDGNLDDDDGCSGDCLTADCLVPITHATVQAAAADAACPTVWIMPGTYTENVVVDRDVTFEQVPLDDVILDGGAAGSTIDITAGTVILRGIIVQNGQAAEGGGIRASSPLVLEGSTVRMNTASQAGGGIFAMSDLTLDGSHVVSNTVTPGDPLADTGGGGIYAILGTIVVTNGSTISQNAVTIPSAMGGIARGGGALLSLVDLTLDGGSEVDGNTISVVGGTDGPTAQGAGLHVESGTASLDGASVTNNVATATATGFLSATSSCGGLSAAGVTLTMTAGTAISGNQAVATSNDGARADGGGLCFAGGVTLSATSVDIADNSAEAHNDAGGPFGSLAFGGAVVIRVFGGAESTFSLTDSTITGNTATATTDGDGIPTGRAGAFHLASLNDGSVAYLELVGCTVDGNTVDADDSALGGAVYTETFNGGASTRIRLDSTTVSGNAATSSLGLAQGGGLYGAVIDGTGGTTVEIVNSTLSGNTVDGTSAGGGAVYLRRSLNPGSALARLVVTSTTITLNETTGEGGGIVAQGASGSITAEIGNTILYGNLAPVSPECSTSGGTTLVSNGYSVLGDLTGCIVGGPAVGDITDMDPMLGPLLDNGGPTQTHAVDALSAAVDAGDPNGCADLDRGVLAFDQRGLERESGGRCDIGAFELQQ